MRYDALASKDAVKKIMEAVKSRGIKPEFVNTKEAALKRLKELIPSGGRDQYGTQQLLMKLGFIDLLKIRETSWKNWKDVILEEKDAAKQMELRRKSVLSNYYLGSVHAVAETGEIVIASVQAVSFLLIYIRAIMSYGSQGLRK